MSWLWATRCKLEQDIIANKWHWLSSHFDTLSSLFNQSHKINKEIVRSCCWMSPKYKEGKYLMNFFRENSLSKNSALSLAKFQRKTPRLIGISWLCPDLTHVYKTHIKYLSLGIDKWDHHSTYNVREVSSFWHRKWQIPMIPMRYQNFRVYFNTRMSSSPPRNICCCWLAGPMRSRFCTLHVKTRHSIWWLTKGVD